MTSSKLFSNICWLKLTLGWQQAIFQHHSPGSHQCSHCYMVTNGSQLLPPPSLPRHAYTAVCVPDMHIQLCALNFISPPLSPETQNLSRRQEQDRWPITPPSFNSQICIQNLWKHINFLHLHVDKKYLSCISVYINDYILIFLLHSL